MEMYFADKVASNWQVMATFGDLFPRLPSGECRRNGLFSHQAATERPEDKTTPQRYSPRCLKGVQHAEMVSAFPMRTFPGTLLQRATTLNEHFAGQCKADLLVIMIQMQKDCGLME